MLPPEPDSRAPIHAESAAARYPRYLPLCVPRELQTQPECSHSGGKYLYSPQTQQEREEKKVFRICQRHWTRADTTGTLTLSPHNQSILWSSIIMVLAAP
jgi:hypothetical protein